MSIREDCTDDFYDCHLMFHLRHLRIQIETAVKRTMKTRIAS